MRSFLVPIAFAAALVAAAPASAQRPSLADRIAILEQRAADNQGNIDLLNQLTALRTEVQALRAQVEELQQQNEQLRTTSQHQYLDLDGRLERLEGGGALPPAASGGVGPAPANPPAAPPVREPAPTIRGDAGSLSQMQVADERAAYEAAFDALRSGRYEESASRFQQFLAQFPSGTYAPNARYWLGESFYVTQNYAQALEQFQALVQRYPTHDKTPGSLLKIGLSQYGLNDLDAAEATLARVGQQYPGTDAARTAEDRLHAIQISRLR
jgi:tol-pal system protein YbgF